MPLLLNRLICGLLLVLAGGSGFAAEQNPLEAQRSAMLRESRALCAAAPELKAKDPDFADWLEQQGVILARLGECIQGDLAANPRRAQSELGDFRYLLDRIAAEIDFVRKAPDLQAGGRYNVRDFGARGDGVTDDGPAIRKAIAAAAAPTSTRRMVFLPKGSYLVKNDPASQPYSPAHPQGAMLGDALVLDGLSNLLIAGEAGTELITPYVFGAAIKVGNCNNVRLRNLTIRQLIRPYTTGTLAAISGDTSFDLLLDPGMEPPTAPWYKHDLSVFKGLLRFYSKELQKDGVTPQFSSVASHAVDPGITALGGNRYRFTLREPTPVKAYYQVGMRVVLYARSHPFGGIVNGHSERSRFENIQLDSSSNLAFFNCSSDLFFIVGCRVEGAPGSWQSANSDGIYTSNSTLGGYVARNTIRHLGDDFINIHSFLWPANRRDGNVLYLPGNFDEWILKRCRRIGYIPSSKGRLDVADEVKIVSYEVLGQGAGYKVTCDRPLTGLVTREEAGGKMPDMIVLLENQCHGCVFKDNYFGDGSSRIIAGGRNWIFRNNLVNDTLAWVVLFQIGPESFNPDGGEGITPRNLIITGNQFRSNAKTLFRMRWGSPVAASSQPPYAADHILISRNEIAFHGGSGRPPFELDDVDGAEIIGNRISTTDAIDAPVFLAGQGKHVSIRDNVITGPFGSLTDNPAALEFRNNRVHLPAPKAPPP